MIHRRLTGEMKESRRYIAAHVACQWLSLAANIAMMALAARLIGRLYEGRAGAGDLALTAALAAALGTVRFFCAVLSGRMGYLSAGAVKRTLREKIFRKLLRLGPSYQERVGTAEAVQLAVEGAEQLETYFGAYLPQLFYALLAPVTLFAALCRISLPAAAVLLACVPLIPATIAVVQRCGKRLLSQYWGKYAALGDTFLENLQGLTTAKIYRTDAFKHQQMREQAEQFRRITMKVLTMQLNSVTVLDLIACGGAAAGTVLAVLQLRAGAVSLSGCLLIVLLSAEFFLPMRLLGSYFHIAMNGMAAADKIFRLLDLPEPENGAAPLPAACSIRCRDLCFSYGPERPVLRHVDLDIPRGGFVAVVGESGSGKSTLAAILTGRLRGYTGTVTVGGVPLKTIDGAKWMQGVTYVGHESRLFKGTVRENLLMARPDASDARLWQVLRQADLDALFRRAQGLDTPLTEQGANLSGGQRQRLSLARALLHESAVYIFDEATSNVDRESEDAIIREIHGLARDKTVVLIAHRLSNVTAADTIYVLDRGAVAEAGPHCRLVAQKGPYAALWNAQQELEAYVTEGGIS